MFIIFLWLVKSLENLEKCGLFSDFQDDFTSSGSTADLLAIVSDRIARAFNRSGATQAVALDIFKAFDRVCHADLLHKIRSYRISGQIFGLTSSFLSNGCLWVVPNGKSSQEYPVNAGVPRGSTLGPTLFPLYINNLPDDVTCNIAIYTADATLYSKCDQASDLWQQLRLASELEPDLHETHNLKIPHKNKSLSLFHINACSLNKNSDDLQHLLSSTKKVFDIIAVSETRITKQISLLNNLNLNHYSFEFTPTETSAGGTLLYIANHLSYKCRNDLNIYKKNELESTFIEIVNPKKSNIILGVIYRHPSMDLPDFNRNYLN